jgi:hypothetical protein
MAAPFTPPTLSAFARVVRARRTMQYVEVDGSKIHPPVAGPVLLTRTEAKAILQGRTPDGIGIVDDQLRRRLTVVP